MIVSSLNKRGQSDIISKALLMLGMLDRSSEDNLVLNHVALLLEDYEQNKDETERLLCSLISLILGAFSIHLDPESTLYTQIRLLQFRLSTPITDKELIALQHYVEACADQITQSEDSTVENISATLEPLCRIFGLKAEGRHSDGQNKAEPLKTNRQHSKDHVRASLAIKDFGESLNKFFATNYLFSGIEQSEKFGTLLEVELAALKKIDDAEVFETKKNAVIFELEKVLKSHKQLVTHFQKTSDFVSTLQQDSERLNYELDRVTLLSLTDELTGLPNRRAFLQRLEDEIARVKRYGHKLSIALLDIDYFKPINDLYGHNAGDKVLKSYADTVLSAFRQYDMVARYGGEEFVVIFPNTDLNGAFRALKKVQKRTESSQVDIGVDKIPLPTFSAGLVEYKGETEVESLIQRADTVLYDAKINGRNRIELEQSAAFLDSEC